jgi:hypothetical protein
MKSFIHHVALLLLPFLSPATASQTSNATFTYLNPVNNSSVPPLLYCAADQPTEQDLRMSDTVRMSTIDCGNIFWEFQAYAGYLTLSGPGSWPLLYSNGSCALSIATWTLDGNSAWMRYAVPSCSYLMLLSNARADNPQRVARRLRHRS